MGRCGGPFLRRPAGPEGLVLGVDIYREVFLYVWAGPGGLPLASLPLPFAFASASWFCLFPLASSGPDLGVWAYKQKSVCIKLSGTFCGCCGGRELRNGRGPDTFSKNWAAEQSLAVKLRFVPVASPGELRSFRSLV